MQQYINYFIVVISCFTVWLTTKLYYENLIKKQRIEVLQYIQKDEFVNMNIGKYLIERNIKF